MATAIYHEPEYIQARCAGRLVGFVWYAIHPRVWPTFDPNASGPYLHDDTGGPEAVYVYRAYSETMEAYFGMLKEVKALGLPVWGWMPANLRLKSVVDRRYRKKEWK